TKPPASTEIGLIWLRAGFAGSIRTSPVTSLLAPTTRVGCPRRTSSMTKRTSERSWTMVKVRGPAAEGSAGAAAGMVSAAGAAAAVFVGSTVGSTTDSTAAGAAGGAAGTCDSTPAAQAVRPQRQSINKGTV